MKKIKIEQHFNQSADEVWAIFADVTRCDWVPAIEKITLSGDVRSFDMAGLEHAGYQELVSPTTPIETTFPLSLGSVFKLHPGDEERQPRVVEEGGLSQPGGRRRSGTAPLFLKR